MLRLQRYGFTATNDIGALDFLHATMVWQDELFSTNHNGLPSRRITVSQHFTNFCLELAWHKRKSPVVLALALKLENAIAPKATTAATAIVLYDTYMLVMVFSFGLNDHD